MFNWSNCYLNNLFFLIAKLKIAITISSRFILMLLICVVCSFSEKHFVRVGRHSCISILPTISTMMEKKWMTRFTNILLNTLYLLSNNSDFENITQLPWRALLDSTNCWYVDMDHKMFNLVVLLDLKKAFDTIDHGILLRKSEFYGITGSVLAMIRYYYN